MSISSVKCFGLVAMLLIVGVSAFGQEVPAKKEPVKAEKKSSGKSKATPAEVTAEQVVESSIFIYSPQGGRDKMLQIRKSEFERGKLTMHEADGKSTNANYQRWVSRPESGKERFRLDQEVPTATYALVQNDDKIFGIFNDSVFQPRADAISAFQNRLVHSIDSLLYYKENGSKLGFAGREKILGVEYYVIDLTDKKDRKTRYFVSQKSFKIMLLEYESSGLKYTRRYRDYKYAQGVLFPFNSELRMGEKVIEEVHVGTVTFGQKVDEGMFASAG